MCEMVEPRTELSDQEIWKIIVDNTPLFYHFCRRRKLPRHMLEDLVTETQLLAFRRMKAGDLDKASLSHIINFAVRRTSYQLYSDLISFTKIPTTVYSRIGDICSILANNENGKAVGMIRDAHFPRLTIADVSVVVNSMYKMDPRTLHSKKDEAKNPYNNWIENFVQSEDHLPEDTIKIDIFEVISENKHQFTDSCEHSMYAIGRRYGLEEKLSEIYPDLFSHNPHLGESEEPTYKKIGEELGISPGSVRNHEMRAIKKLKKMMNTRSITNRR